MKTKAQLRKVVLTTMVVIDPEENPSSEQAQTLDLYVDSARAQLLEQGLCWWDEGAIPDAVLVPLSQYVISQCCGAFGRAGKGYEAWESAATVKLSSLKATSAREDTAHEFF